MDAARLVQRAEALLERQAELLDRWACDVADCDGNPHPGWLHQHARASQWEPTDYEIWLIMTGRGWGKTKTGAETAKGWTRHARRHIAVIGKTDRDARNVCFEGPAGLLNVIRPKFIQSYNRSGGDTVLTLKNGSIFRAFSAANPEGLRGYAFDSVWIDEFGSYPHQTAQDVIDNCWFCLREARFPRLMVTTTPRNVPHMKDLIEAASVITRGHTNENKANLSAAALRTLERRYGGTRIGRQELAGELVDDVEGALWQQWLIDEDRLEEVPADVRRIVVGVDPAGTAKATSDETGIVVVGVGGNYNYPTVYVLEDGSGHYSPDGWANKVNWLFDKWSADCVVAEVNFGADMVRSVLQQSNRNLPVHEVRASRGKWIRAEPVAAVYEQRRVHHIGPFPKLEDQMVGWTPDSGESPDRLDALVWGVTELLNFGPVVLQSPNTLRPIRR